MALTCKRAARLSLSAVGGHASEAERLELEGHLGVCARCSAEHGALATVRRLREAEADELTPAARERVRRAVMGQPVRAAAPVHRLRWPAGVAATLAVAAGIALWVTTTRPVPGPRVLGGDVVTVGEPSGPAASGLRLRSDRSGEVQLDEARATLARTTEIVWRRERRSVELRTGSITIDVEHRPGQHFEVRTPRFTVEVVGTRFSVDLGGVRTERGNVRVLSPDGKLLAYVQAGRAWSVPEVTPPAPEPPTVVVPAPPREAPPAPVAPTAPAEESPAARLGRARRALARGNAAEARRAVEPAFRLGREVAAEARALYAESFLIEGRYTDAVDGYEVVIRDFPSSPQAESALYAVAQLESEHGHPAAARAALERYLARYPKGRFAKEAADRLVRVSPPRR